MNWQDKTLYDVQCNVGQSAQVHYWLQRSWNIFLEQPHTFNQIVHNIKNVSINFENISAILDFIILQILQKIGKPKGRVTFFWRPWLYSLYKVSLGTRGWWSREKTLCHIGTYVMDYAKPLTRQYRVRKNILLPKICKVFFHHVHLQLTAQEFRKHFSILG